MPVREWCRRGSREKLIFMFRHWDARYSQNIMIVVYTFEDMSKFKYVGTTVRT